MRTGDLPSTALVVLSALLLGGCASHPVGSALPIKPYTYLVGPADVLKVEVFGDTTLEKDVTVTPDGMISFPLIGEVKVLDKSVPEIAALVHQQLLKAVTNPSVTVTLAESKSQKVQIVGEVGHQGPVPFQLRLSLVEAINQAGGVEWPYAKLEAVHIVRGPLASPVLIPVDLDDVFDADATDVYLQPGDIVVVPAKWVTRWDRYVRQLLAPIAVVGGGGLTAAKTAP